MALRPSSPRRVVRLTALLTLAAGMVGVRPPTMGGALAAGGGSALPAPGVYRYAVHGSECAKIAVFQDCHTFSSPATMTVSRTPTTTTLELDLSSGHLEASRYTLRPDGRYLTWQRTRVDFAISQDDAAPAVPPTLAMPSTLRVGQHWTQRFSVGGLPVTTTDRVARHSVLTVGGTHVAVYEIDASSTIGGAHAGTENDGTWHDPRSGLDLRLTIQRRIGGVFPYKMDLDATLLSLQPAR